MHNQDEARDQPEPDESEQPSQNPIRPALEAAETTGTPEPATTPDTTRTPAKTRMLVRHGHHGIPAVPS
jgi:hypothetical protein